MTDWPTHWPSDSTNYKEMLSHLKNFYSLVLEDVGVATSTDVGVPSQVPRPTFMAVGEPD